MKFTYPETVLSGACSTAAFPPAVACPSALGQLLNVHVELGDLVGPRLTMQASLSTDRKLLIGIRKTGNNQDNDGLGLFNAQMPLQTAEGF